MSLAPFGLFSGVGDRRLADPFMIEDVLGDYDRQMRHMMRDLNRLERRFMGGDVEGQLMNNFGALNSLTDRGAILPHIVEENGKQLMQYNFDVKGFKPEDVHIKTNDGKLIVCAKREDVGEDHHSIREFRRMVAIPEGVEVTGMKSNLDNRGVLTISAPYSAPAIEHQQQRTELPIHHEKAANKAIK